MTSTLSPVRSTPSKAGSKRKFSTLGSPSFSSEKRSRQTTGAGHQSIVLRRPKEPVGEPWPLRELLAYDTPTDINYGPMLKDVLTARGWKLSTKPCNFAYDEDACVTSFFMKEFEATLRGQAPEKLFGKKGSVQGSVSFGKKGSFPGSVSGLHQLQANPLPKHALWMLGRLPYRVPGTCNDASREREDFVKTLVEHGGQLPGKPGNYRIAKFPGTETLLYKTHLTDAFKDKPWYPLTFILPKDKASFQKEVRARGNAKNNMWIGKPRNDYGGTGIKVWKGTDSDLAKEIRETEKASLFQYYLYDPLLIGGYKFHMRIHLVITSVDPVQAYVQENGQCLFATKPYTLANNTLGAFFDPPVHVTNMCLNAKPENKDNYFKKKPLIGKGQQCRVKQLVSHLEENWKGFDKQDLWQQILNISADTANYIAKGVQKNNKFVKDRHFELFGMDLMLDKDMKVWMCEVNTDPGLSYPDEEVLGSPNPDYQKELQACRETFHDIFSLIGLDAGREQSQGSLRHWFELDCSNTNTKSQKIGGA